MPTLIHTGTNSAGPTPGTTISASLTTVTAGNLVIVSVSTFGGTTNVTDTGGNTYTKRLTVTESFTGKIVDIWDSVIVTGGGSFSVTATQATNNALEIIAEEWSGLVPVPLDKTKTATGSASTADTGNTATTSSSNELIWSTGFIYGVQSDFSPISVTIGSGYSNFHSAGAGSGVLYSESKSVTSKAAYNATYNVSAPAGFGPSSPRWAVAALTYIAPYTQTIAATASAVGALTKFKARFVTIAATVSTSANFVKTINKTLAAVVVANPAVNRLLNITISAVVSTVAFMNPAKRGPDVAVKPHLKVKK